MSVLHPDQFTQHLSDLEQNYGISIGPGHMRTENGLMIPISDWSANSYSDPESGFNETALSLDLPDEYGNIHRMTVQNSSDEGPNYLGGHTSLYTSEDDDRPSDPHFGTFRHIGAGRGGASDIEDMWESMRGLGSPSGTRMRRNQETLRDLNGWGDLRHFGPVNMVHARRDSPDWLGNENNINFGYDLGRRQQAR